LRSVRSGEAVCLRGEPFCLRNPAVAIRSKTISINLEFDDPLLLGVEDRLERCNLPSDNIAPSRHLVAVGSVS
jgi:hypothetical protein